MYFTKKLLFLILLLNFSLVARAMDNVYFLHDLDSSSLVDALEKIKNNDAQKIEIKICNSTFDDKAWAMMLDLLYLPGKIKILHLDKYCEFEIRNFKKFPPSQSLSLCELKIHHLNNRFIDFYEEVLGPYLKETEVSIIKPRGSK